MAGTVGTKTLQAVGRSGAFLGRLRQELMLLSNTWPVSPSEVPGATLLLRRQNVGNLQKSLVQLLGLPWQLDICSFFIS